MEWVGLCARNQLQVIVGHSQVIGNKSISWTSYIISKLTLFFEAHYRSPGYCHCIGWWPSWVWLPDMPSLSGMVHSLLQKHSHLIMQAIAMKKQQHCLSRREAKVIKRVVRCEGEPGCPSYVWGMINGNDWLMCLSMNSFHATSALLCSRAVGY